MPGEPVSEGTIYRRRVLILGKLGVCSHIELVLFAISRELFSDPQA